MPPREIRSNDLDSPWASDHLYTHQIICFTVTVLQHSIKVLTGKRDLRVGKLRKSVGYFCIRYGLGWALGGLRMNVSSWEVSEKTLKDLIFLPKNVALLPYDKSFNSLLYIFKLITSNCHLSVLKNVYPLPRYSGSKLPYLCCVFMFKRGEQITRENWLKF